MWFGPVQVVSPGSPWHGKAVYLKLTEKGIETITFTAEEPRARLSPGWIDVGAWTWQPQVPSAESLFSLAKRAQRGGFSQVLVGGWHGWSEPALLAQIRAEASDLPAQLHFIAAWADADGNIAPVESLRLEGVVAWALPPLGRISWKTFAKVLPYLRYLGGVVFVLPFWEGAGGEMGVPEAPELALAGWEGIPPYAETVAVHAIAALHRAYGAYVVVGPLTTAEGIRLIREYGLAGFTGISYLAAHAGELLTYAPIWKLHPPLRQKADQASLREAVYERNLFVASWDINPPAEDKHKEWLSAAVGQPTLEQVAPLLWAILRERVDVWEASELLVYILSEKPRHLLGIGPSAIQEGFPLDFTVFRQGELRALPHPWEGYRSDLEVLGTIRCLADAYSLQNQIA